MGLFQRRQQSEIEVLYDVRIAQDNSWLIVGLGNPGNKYDLTRHNVGFEVLDRMVEAENGKWSEKKALKSLVAELKIGSVRLVLIKPTTFMNLSGEAVQAVQHFYKIKNDHTIVVHDELDIDFGRIRTGVGGSAAGHNGIKSLTQHCGEGFGRVRIGIGPKKPEQMDSADFVLQKFSKDEQGNLKTLKTEAISVINEAVFSGQLTADTRSFL